MFDRRPPVTPPFLENRLTAMRYRGLARGPSWTPIHSMEPKRPLIPDWMVSPAYGPDLRFERIAINEGALCIECKACGRHTALTKQCEHIRLGNKRLVKSMKFNQSCGSAEVRLYNAHTRMKPPCGLRAIRCRTGRSAPLQSTLTLAQRNIDSASAWAALASSGGSGEQLRSDFMSIAMRGVLATAAPRCPRPSRCCD